MAKKSRPAPPSSDSSSSDEGEQTSNKTSAPEAPANKNKTGEESDDESEEESEAESSEEEEEDEDDEKSKKPAPETPANNDKKEGESDDESEDGSDDESDEGKEEEEEEDKGKKLEFYASTVSKLASVSGGSGSGAEEESDSDSDSEAAKLITPISSKPMADAPAEKANGKGPFQRIWTSDDEIALLRKLAQFESKNGPVKLNNASLGGFYEVVKKKISVDVSCHQLVEKLRRLKKRYSMMAARTENGNPLQFAKPHDQVLYDLGKTLWEEDDGSEGRVSNGVAANGGEGSSMTELQTSNFSDLKEAVARIGTMFADERFKKLYPIKAEVLDKKLKKQKVAELKLRAQEAELLRETLKLLAEGMERATA